MVRLGLLASIAALAVGVSGVLAQSMSLAPSPAVRARVEALLGQLTQAEKLDLINGQVPILMHDKPADVLASAGYTRGVPRLGIPDIRETDASLGVANAGRPDDDATALPSSLLLASTFDPAIAFNGGAMIGKEARQKGFNVMLDGGVNLVREPRNGRNFEYLGEDPLLAGTLAGEAVRGIQSNSVTSTVKHYALNAQENGRHSLDAVIDWAALRESDLLAFEIAIEKGRPGSVMCAYNKVNGAYACQSKPLLVDVLKRDWGFPGFVMSDWGAAHSAEDANLGLDRESGEQLDKQAFFGAPMQAALASGAVSQSRLDDMVRRILTGMAETGLLDPHSNPGPLDVAADAPVAEVEAEAGIVLLKNQGDLLPLPGSVQRIAVIGGKADVGVLSGGGSSQVVPKGSRLFPAPSWASPWIAGMLYHPSSPLDALRNRLAGATVSFDPGTDPAAAAAAARTADVAIVFATQWASEGSDVSLSLPDRQDQLIAAVAAANPRTIVVLETGGPVLMPWLASVPAVLEAWYPGQRGGEAIARVLAGDVDPSGRLPVSFPQGVGQLPRPSLDADGLKETDDLAKSPTITVTYGEGAEVGYRWYEKQWIQPLFPFGWGLSYTSFSHQTLHVDNGPAVRVTFNITNLGRRAGVDVAQVYAAAPGETRRLIGWARVPLAPGQTQTASVIADPRLLAHFDTSRNVWILPGGAYHITVGRFAGDPYALSAMAMVKPSTLSP
jgi:beta-glucosidase